MIEFIDTNISTSSDVHEDAKQFVQLQMHRYSQSCKKKGIDICRFGSPLPPMKETLIMEPFSSDTEKEVLKAAKQNYEKVLKVLNALPKDAELEFDQFIGQCELTYDQYLGSLRSSLKRKRVLLKRAVKDVRMNAYNLNV